MHTVFALLCSVMVIHWLIFPYPSGLLHWHCGNLTIAPVPAKQPWWIWINTSCEFIMNDCITTPKQSTTKPCAYFFGYTVSTPMQFSKILITRYNIHPLCRFAVSPKNITQFAVTFEFVCHTYLQNTRYLGRQDVLSCWPKLTPIWYISRANQITSCCLLIPKPLPDTMLLFSDLNSGNKFQLKHKTVHKGKFIWKFILLVILLDLNVPPRGNVGVWDMICRHWLCIQCNLSQQGINMCPLS